MIYRLSAILLLSAVFSTSDALVLMRPHTARALKQTKQHVPQKIGSFHRASQFRGCGCLHGLNKDEVSQKQSMHSRGKQISNVLLLLRTFMDGVQKSSIPTVNLLNVLSARHISVSLFAKLRSKFLASFLSFFLIVTCSLRNVASVDARQTYPSQPSATLKKTKKSEIGDAVDHGVKKSEYSPHKSYGGIGQNSKMTKKVTVEFIVAKNDAVGAAAKKIEKKSATIAKQINRRSREVEKSLSNDLSEFEKEAGQEVKQSWESLTGSMKDGYSRSIVSQMDDFGDYAVLLTSKIFGMFVGAKLDTLIMLIVTSAVIPVFKRLNLSPILGFLLMGTVLGPSCLHWIHDVHTIDMLGELGIVFFLFEMGLELSIARLNAMKKDVFGLGTMQFLLTSAAGCGVSLALGLPTSAAVTIGGSLALSSSAFVLQLLKDKNQMGTRAGKASFGILLLQDLAVVPLLVVVELLAKGGTGLGKALSIAGVKALVTLSVMSVLGKKLLDPIFYFVAKSSSHEAFLSIILTTVLLMSFVTQGIGLSNTLGAFLAGLLLAETKYRYQIEADIAPFRGLLLGFFFITVGFNIDLAMIVKEAPKITALLASLILGKASIITALSLMFGMSFANSQLSGLLLAQGGEFAFVALGIAERSGLIERSLCKLLLTTVALSMAATPMLAEIGGYISNRIEQEKGLAHYLGQDSDAEEVKSDSKDFVFVAGYGRVGKMVCDMLDRMPVRYIALDSSPIKAIEARGKGLPVFYGDINRPEVLHNFNVGEAKACVFTIDDMAATNKAVINVRKMYPKLPLLVRAKNTEHQKRLENMFDDIYVMSPVLPEDSVLLTLPFGGAVLQSLGVSKPATDAILEDFRKILMEADKNFTVDTFDFLNSFKKRQTEIASIKLIAGEQPNEEMRKEWAIEEEEIKKIKELDEADVPDYLDGSDVLKAPGIDYMDAPN